VDGYDDTAWGRAIRCCLWFVRPLVHLDVRSIMRVPADEDGLAAPDSYLPFRGFVYL